MKRLIPLLIILVGCSSAEEQWTELFDGESLNGWHIYGGDDNFNGWYVDNGVLVFDPELRTAPTSSNLVTNKQYKDFELSIEWMISQEGNSGIFWGVVESDEYEHPYQTGPEVQILDDNWSEYVDERGDINRAGSLFNLIAPTKIVSKPAGEWNHMLLHIDQTNNLGFLEYNSAEVMRFNVNGPEWEDLIANSNFADWPGFGTSQTGYISLQDHGNKVAFRRIRIRELNQR